MKLKNILLIVTFSFLYEFAGAQTSSLSDFYTVGSPSYTGGYFSPVAKQTKFLDQNGYVLGARVGLTLNESLIIGASGYDLSSEVEYDPQTERDFDISYGGAFVGWTFFPRNLVNFTIINNIAWGSLKLERKPGEEYLNDTEHDFVQIIEPELLAEINITNHVRAGLGYGWRFVRGRDFDEISRNDLDGSSAMINVSFVENLASYNGH